MFNYKIFFILLIFVIVYKSNAVTEKDTIVLGPNYINEIWYNLDSGVIQTADKDNWDIAFQTGQKGAIWINGQKGERAWVVPGKTIDDFSKSVDTTGMDQTWEYHTNSDENWDIGAFNLGMDGYESDGDFGWGSYDLSSHAITGTKIFIIKIDKKTYKKFMIESLFGSEYSFSYANLDGSDESIGVIKKSDFKNKNFAYFSFSENKSIDREPINKEWQLLFGKYEALIDNGQGGTMPYYLTGIRHNFNVKVAKLTGVDPKTVAPPAFITENFNTKITAIGADWKKYNSTNSTYEIPSDLVYFLTTDTLGTPKPKIYRIVFKEFTGSTLGQIIFEKEELPMSVIEKDGKPLGNFSVYPNLISTNDNLNVVYELYENTQYIKIAIYSSTGDIVYSANENAVPGLNTININNLNVCAGMYLVTFEVNGKIGTEKLLVK
jgi:hypothetical protein